MEQDNKRKANELSRDRDKRARIKKQWRTPRKNEGHPSLPQTIQPGDSGIWVTCNKGREGKCIGEMRDLFDEYAERLYPDVAGQRQDGEEGEDGDDRQGDDTETRTGSTAQSGKPDIEQVIQAEIQDVRQPRTAPRLFLPIRIDVQCVVFFKTVAPVDPVSLVKTICEEAMADRQRKRTRSAKRLSPTTLIGRASTEGLAKVAAQVLAPHFHQELVPKRKFAIRPTIRNHHVLTRDSVIKLVASLVGPDHEVDLTNYELLIVVEVYQNVCGVSVLDRSFERCKRYNLAEIFDPTPSDG